MNANFRIFPLFSVRDTKKTKESDTFRLEYYLYPDQQVTEDMVDPDLFIFFKAF